MRVVATVRDWFLYIPTCQLGRPYTSSSASVLNSEVTPYSAEKYILLSFHCSTCQVRTNGAGNFQIIAKSRINKLCKVGVIYSGLERFQNARWKFAV